KPSSNKSFGHAIFILKKLSPFCPNWIPGDKNKLTFSLKNSDKEVENSQPSKFSPLSLQIFVRGDKQKIKFYSCS
ncbi:MAG: hypothetical protein IJM82_03765, partial [Synergistaceae bacterium]|nr:hypothetical protein [Synergistaceae bacterium]